MNDHTGKYKDRVPFRPSDNPHHSGDKREKNRDHLVVAPLTVTLEVSKVFYGADQIECHAGYRPDEKIMHGIDNSVAKLEKKLGQRVALECVVDPQILGGAIIETENTVIDGSLRRKIQEVKEVIKGEPKT